MSGYPKLVAEWDGPKNGHVVPLDVAFGSKRRFWWKCAKGPDHEWQASVGNRTRLGNQCPFCQHKKVSVTNSLATLAPNVAREWHPTKNGALTPHDITSAASRSVWWKCSGCQGSWKATVGNRTGRNSGCPPCSTRRRVAIQSRPRAKESLAHVAPHLVREWHTEKNAPMTPRDVSWGSRERVWWRCSRDPKHEWQIAISNRSRENLPSGCPHCWRQRQRTTIKPPPFEKSLAHRVPTLARQWHPERNGKLTPSDVSIGSGRRVWWRCAFNHVWSTPVRARAMAGNNCPDCRRERGKRLRAA
ncbi:zinc-ribbon domain-containing protein [Pendulispora albinea]|uniref:Zinc-ribbon domain-containing protein n=1 Tax=Pendulispora albinea TaxID=2741071 RepID=A0ABZ2M2E0_9BACT